MARRPEGRQPAEPAKSAKFVQPLSKPIQAHGETLNELSFQAPSGLDMLELGNPVNFDMASDPPRVTHDWRIMGPMISRLAQIPMGSVSSMEPTDLVACAWLLTPFFVPSQA